MRLSELQTGQTGIVLNVLGHGAFRKRIMEMGFVRGKSVAAVMNAPLKDPIVYKIMDYEVSLRISEASMIEIITVEEAAKLSGAEPGTETLTSEAIERVIERSGREIRVVLVGNPNCGKTSLFNIASGGHEHVGNYSGVTVDAKRGHFEHGGYRITIYDLPGTYALSAYSPEERYVRRLLAEETPDVIVNVVAASNLERNLYLTTELIDMDTRVVIALNMYDELQQSGAKLDFRSLGRMIGVPIVPTVSRSGRGIRHLFDTVIDVFENREKSVRHIHINHGQAIESGIGALKEMIKGDATVPKQFSPRYLALKMLEGDSQVEELLKKNASSYAALSAMRDLHVKRIGKELGEDVETAVTNAKYGFITGALRETLTPGNKDEVQTTRAIDTVVTSKLFGFPIFLLIMWAMFEATFTLGSYPMGWIESLVGWCASLVESWMDEGALKDLIIDGVIGGVGGVIVFLPNILILYFFISFMEDSGYMARAAFIMDRIMHRIGLHGKSFIPLVMGFGCNVPAIIAARTIESRSSRIITVLINPFMSCSARLPVYILFVGVFFPRHASLVFIGLYLLGIVLAVITAKLLRKFLFPRDETPFVMELPPYRMPTMRSALVHMWDKAAQYLRKMGGIILVASMAVWFLSYFPRTPQAGTRVEDGAGAFVQTDRATLVEQQQKNSYLGRVGQFCEPAVEPLGFNWKISVALLSGTAAKEVIVSTIGVLYSDNGDSGSAVLSKKITAVNPETGRPDFTPAVALSFLVFVLLYFPCLASLAAIAGETGSWRWALFSVIYNTVLAWVMAFAVYNISLLFI